MLIASAAVAEENRWRKLPPPPGRAEGIRSIALEHNTLWAMASNSVFYWDGARWHKPIGPDLRGGTYLTSLIGGGDRPLYCTQSSPQEGKALLYRLSDGASHFVTDFAHERSTFRPNIFVSRSGIVFHRMRGQIGILDGNTWNIVKTPDTKLSFFDNGPTVCLCFLHSKKMLEIRNGVVAATRELNLKLPVQPRSIRSIRWGDNRVLVLQRSKPKIQCFELDSGDLVDVKSVQDELGPVTLDDGFSTRDGSAWILERRVKSPDYHLVRITADGDVQEVASSNQIDMQNFGLRRTPRGVLETKDGSLWFGLNDSIVKYTGGSSIQFNQNTGYDLSACYLIEDQQGTIYASNGGVYAFYRYVEPPEHLTPPSIAQEPARTVWRHPIEGRPRFEASWLDGNTVYVTGSSLPLLAIQADTGVERFRQALRSIEKGSAPGDIPWWMARVGKTIEFAAGQEVVRVDASTGEIQSRLDLPHDRRIAPVKIPAGYLVVPEYRGREMVAVDEDGEIRWRRNLPGYLMAHPTVNEKHVVMQTRGSSYGGQATLCIDFSDGTVLWNDNTDAYGQGVAFGKAGSLIVETDDWLSPQRTESWTIGRSADGTRAWQHREEEHRSRPPIVDLSTNLVYSILSAGKVVCLRGYDGEVVWQQTLSEGLSQIGGASPYFPAWSPHSLQDGKLLIVDKSKTLHVLNAESGELIVSVVLDGNPPPSPDRSSKLIAPPWITARTIIAAFQHEIIAIPLPKELQEPDGPRTTSPATLAVVDCRRMTSQVPSRRARLGARCIQAFGRLFSRKRTLNCSRRLWQP